MRLVFTAQGWEDYTHWQRADRSNLKRIRYHYNTSEPSPRRRAGATAAGPS